MLLNEFSQNYFKPVNENQNSLIEEFKKIRAKRGMPSRLRILRTLVRTRHFTHTVYPPGWKFE
jgi:hypothetical protein